MKKTLFILTNLLGVVALIGLLCGSAAASVTGECSNCHTMHSSQGDASAIPSTWDTTEIRGSLLATSCVGCHTTSGTDPYDDVTPFIKGTNLSDTNCLAGGFLTDNPDDDHSDNSHSIGSTATPAGYTGDWYNGTSTGLKCAGSSGCHGYEDEPDEVKAIAGGHHENDLKPALGYRMLVVNGTLVGGTEASDYEESLISSGTGAHNVYCAGTDSTNATISELCAKCHGNFHGDGTVNADGAWIRHPSDAAIPSGWAIGNTGYTLTGQDYVNNPVGYVDGDETTSTRYVTCLSCHRAHGTGHADLLRWDYSTQVADSGTTYGCLGCHDRQR